MRLNVMPGHMPGRTDVPFVRTTCNAGRGCVFCRAIPRATPRASHVRNEAEPCLFRRPKNVRLNAWTDFGETAQHASLALRWHAGLDRTPVAVAAQWTRNAFRATSRRGGLGGATACVGLRVWADISNRIRPNASNAQM